jgi:hypothetical protein
MNSILVNLTKEYLPYLLAFLLGVIVAWKGCGNTGEDPITNIIKAPVPTVEYVDRWKTDTVRFVYKQVITVHDTVHSTVHNTYSDTLFIVDTISIVEAWLTEVAKYDTTVNDIRLTWQNYQNRTENLSVAYTPKKVVGAKFALGLHANVGLLSNFKDSYTPLMGIGVQCTIKNTYISANYGYNGQHFIGVGIGRNLIGR